MSVLWWHLLLAVGRYGIEAFSWALPALVYVVSAAGHDGVSYRDILRR